MLLILREFYLFSGFNVAGDAMKNELKLWSVSDLVVLESDLSCSGPIIWRTIICDPRSLDIETKKETGLIHSVNQYRGISRSVSFGLLDWNKEYHTE